MSNDRRKGGAEDPMDHDLMRRYREASAEMDERPAASARASVIAAAAREVGARPMDIAANRRIRPRWPLAAAAAVMLSTLAVMLAIRTDEEMPQFSPTPEPARSVAEQVAPAAPPASAPVIDQAERQQASTPMASAPTEDRRAQMRTEPPAARARRDGDGFADLPQKTPPTPARKNSVADASAIEKDATAPPPENKPAPLAKLRAEEAESGLAAQTRPADPAAADARRDAARPASSAPSVPSQLGGAKAEETAAAWLDRIVKLRAAGRNDEADAELKRFRERYPQVQLPAEALPATGTR